MLYRFEDNFINMQNKLVSCDDWDERLHIADDIISLCKKYQQKPEINLNMYSTGIILGNLSKTENYKIASSLSFDEYYPYRDIIDTTLKYFTKVHDTPELKGKMEVKAELVKDIYHRINKAKLILTDMLDEAEENKRKNVDSLRMKKEFHGFHEVGIILSNSNLTPENNEKILNIINNSVDVDSLDVSIGNLKDDEYDYLFQYVSFITTLVGIDHWLTKCVSSSMIDHEYFKHKVLISNNLDKNLLPQTIALLCTQIRKIRNTLPKDALPRADDDEDDKSFIGMINKSIK